MSITPEQCRAARALLGWSQPDLADAVGIARETIAHFERGARTPHPNNLTAIRSTLEAAGIDFIDPNGGGQGVRMRK